jgi:hypothetical protein
MVGAVKATGVASTDARSKGKLWAFFYSFGCLVLLPGLDYIITISGVGRLNLLLRKLYSSGSL